MVSRIVRSILFVAFAPTVLLAQDSTDVTLPFRAHQWAMEFGGGFGSVGVLKFSTPARAWLLNLQVSGGHTHRSDGGFQSNANGTLTLGRRFYQTRGRTVASYQTLGVLGSLSHSCANDPTIGGFCGNGWALGVSGELGGAYFLTPHFSIGGSVTATISYGHTSSGPTGGPPAGRTWTTNASIATPVFRADIYF